MMKDIFQQNIVLENERVLLRPLEASDYENLLPFGLQEPEIWRYSLLTGAGAENLKKYIDDAVENRKQQKEYPFIVFDKQTKQYAGSTRFYDIQQAFLTTQLGYTWYGKNFQRTGLNRHCKFLLFSFVFEQWGLERLELRADSKNERSIAAMKAIGCVPEGILRNNMPTRFDYRRSSIVLSILKDEWFGGVKEMLKGKIL